MADDEPVAYLGGESGDGPVDPAPADDEVDGYLGGAAPDQVEEELPALPPQDEASGYSAKDFLDSDAQEVPAEDPYADPYAQPADGQEGYGDYAGYDAAAVEQSDPSYFDSMAHGTGAEEAAPPVEDYATEDPDQPKTISQQDAESIIRRITTKRILPPDAGEKKVAPPPPPKLTEAGGGVKVLPILVVLLIVAGMGVGIFGKELREQFPFLEPYMPWLEPMPKTVTEDVVPKVDPNAVAKKKFLDMVLLSEAKAFGMAVKDVPSTAPKVGPGAGTSSGSGTDTSATPGTGSSTDAGAGTSTDSTGGDK